MFSYRTPYLHQANLAKDPPPRITNVTEKVCSHPDFRAAHTLNPTDLIAGALSEHDHPRI